MILFTNFTSDYLFFPFLQCYTHNNLGWKIHVVDPGTTLHRNGVNTISLNASLFLIVNLIAIYYANAIKCSL